MDRDKESRTRENGLHLWYLVRFDASQSLEEVAGRLSRLGELSKVQYNGTMKKYSARAMQRNRPSCRELRKGPDCPSMLIRVFPDNGTI